MKRKNDSFKNMHTYIWSYVMHPKASYASVVLTALLRS